MSYGFCYIIVFVSAVVSYTDAHISFYFSPSTWYAVEYICIVVSTCHTILLYPVDISYTVKSVGSIKIVVQKMSFLYT